jgi:hypothetical protein
VSSLCTGSLGALVRPPHGRQLGVPLATDIRDP